MSQVVTQERAAQLLGVSRRTLQRYLQRGLLRIVHQGKKICLYEEDVYQLKRSKNDPFPLAVSRTTLAMMMGEILSLKTMVGTLARLLNVKYEPLNLTDSEYKNLFLMAELFANEGWPPHVEEMWADTFLRMKIEDFQRLAEVTQDPHPWRPFLKLARSMHESPSNQALKDQFGAGRNNIHAVAGIFCVTAGVSPKDFTLLSERDAVPSKKLIKGRLKSQKAQQDKEEEKNPFQGPF